MKLKGWTWIIAALALALAGVPLVAQQTQPAAEPEAASTAPAPDAPPAAETAEPVSQESAQPADEKLSVDNSLSFPVDI
jgi:hypothetical protein